jgi:hypothetical protein
VTRVAFVARYDRLFFISYYIIRISSTVSLSTFILHKYAVLLMVMDARHHFVIIGTMSFCHKGVV